MEVLTLFSVTKARQTKDLAEALEGRYPWAILYRGMTDPAATGAMEAWIAAGPQIPEGLPMRAREALCALGPIDDFPLAVTLRSYLHGMALRERRSARAGLGHDGGQ